MAMLTYAEIADLFTAQDYTRSYIDLSYDTSTRQIPSDLAVGKISVYSVIKSLRDIINDTIDNDPLPPITFTKLSIPDTNTGLELRTFYQAIVDNMVANESKYHRSIQTVIAYTQSDSQTVKSNSNNVSYTYTIHNNGYAQSYVESDSKTLKYAQSNSKSMQNTAQADINGYTKSGNSYTSNSQTTKSNGNSQSGTIFNYTKTTCPNGYTQSYTKTSYAYDINQNGYSKTTVNVFDYSQTISYTNTDNKTCSETAKTTYTNVDSRTTKSNEYTQSDTKTSTSHKNQNNVTANSISTPCKDCVYSTNCTQSSSGGFDHSL